MKASRQASVFTFVPRLAMTGYLLDAARATFGSVSSRGGHQTEGGLEPKLSPTILAHHNGGS
jgi:hypothetical protein